MADFGIGAYNTRSCSFRGIHRGSASERNKSVAAVIQIELLNLVHRVDCGVGFDLRKQDMANSRIVQRCQNTRGQLLSN